VTFELRSEDGVCTPLVFEFAREWVSCPLVTGWPFEVLLLFPLE
jgi:hypothetical protein